MEHLLKIDIQDTAFGLGNDTKIVRLVGELAMNNSIQIKNALEPLIDKGVLYMVFDMTELRFIDSIGTLNLINIHIKAKRRGGNVSIVGINPHIKEIFDAVGLTNMITLCNTVDEALALVKQKKTL